MRRWGVLVMLVVLSDLSTAGGLPEGVFIEALRAGQASGPIPPDQKFERAVHALKLSTGSAGEITILAWRLKRFTQQSRCGRIAFALSQKATNMIWPQTGGQLNICDDGLPPLQTCDGATPYLVLPGTRCKDGSAPHDTTEVSAAIAEGLASGSLTEEQAREKRNAGRRGEKGGS